MSKTLKLLLILTILTSCSIHESAKFWKKKEITPAQKEESIQVFKKKESIKVEFNQNLKINFSQKPIDNSFINNLTNNNGRVNYIGNLKNISKYKFSKIKYFYKYEPEPSFNESNIIFFDKKGSILNFDNSSKLKWKKNYYSKLEQKQNTILFFANNKNLVIVVDNISKFYALDINTGELLWSKKNSAPFNSQIKIYKDKFFVIDYDNILRAYSINNGEEIWNIKTEKSLTRSLKKLSIVIVDEKIYFNNSMGDISSVDINSGELIWQTPTQSNQVFDQSYFLKVSDIIADKNALFFSNNKNEFYSLDIQTGSLIWKQEINSDLRPTIVDDYLLTVSTDGYLIVIEKKSGNIIRVNDIFNSIKPKKRSIVKPVGFIVGIDNIYLTTNLGRLLVIDIVTGKTKSTIKVDNNKISRPIVVNQDLFIITDNSIIKLN